MTEILSARHFGTNAAMMVDVAALYVDLENDYVLDPTYGNGGFWKKVRPKLFVGTDLDPEKSMHGPVDFTALPDPSDFYDVVVYDPAYVVPGGRATSTTKKFNKAYGMDTTKATRGAQWDEVIVPGALECARVLKPKTRGYPGGLLMWKAQNYISSKTYWNYRQEITAQLRSMGFTQVDEFVFVRESGGMQDKNRTKRCPRCKGKGRHRAGPKKLGLTVRCLTCHAAGKVPVEQQHARNNSSFLIIARKGRA